MFSTYAACERLVQIENNTTNRFFSKGTVQFCMTDGRSLTLTEVRHVLSLQKKLIFIRILYSKGCSFPSNGGIMRVFKENNEIMVKDD